MQKVLQFGNQLSELEAERKNTSNDLLKRKRELEVAREHFKRYSFWGARQCCFGIQTIIDGAKQS